MLLFIKEKELTNEIFLQNPDVHHHSHRVCICHSFGYGNRKYHSATESRFV